MRSLLIVSGFTYPIITLTMKILKYVTNESLNYDFNTLLSLGFVRFLALVLVNLFIKRIYQNLHIFKHLAGIKVVLKKLKIVSLEFTFVLIFLMVICM